MSDACAIAVGAVSGLGEGQAAFVGSCVGDGAMFAIARDDELASAGLARPFAARVAGVDDRERGDRATEILARALLQAVRGLDVVRPEWRAERIGIVLGTSSGGMRSSERYFAARAAGLPARECAPLASAATYFAPFDEALARAGLGPNAPGVRRRWQILAACAASTFAVGFALRWLRRGACDIVLAGGYDAVSVFVASGFEALRATTASTPMPFRAGRDGMSLGEGAGVLALVRDSDTRGVPVRARIAGFGASTDAVHITAPDRTGAGLVRAARAAIADADVEAGDIALVSAHGTATPFNDAMEARAIRTVFEGLPLPIVHPFKSQIGHTLGAAGVLEALATADAIAASVAPAARTSGPNDPDADVPLLERATPLDIPAALKLSAAFGGANAALVLTRSARFRQVRSVRRVALRAHAHVRSSDLSELAQATGVARDRLARLDPLCRVGLAAVAALALEVGRERLVGAGIAAGHYLAGLETNERFDARRRSRGATFVEARLFPATSPNAVAGECAIVYALTGPSFATGAGPGGALEALAAGAELVAAGDADQMIVLAADDAGECTRDLLQHTGGTSAPISGAVALLLDKVDDGERARIVDLDMPTTAPSDAVGHLALLAWLQAP